MLTEQVPQLGDSRPGNLQQVKDALKASDDRLRSVLDSMFAFVAVLSADGRVLEVNRAPLEAASLHREDVIGHPFAETYWWSHSTATQKQLRNALRRAAEGETVREDFLVRLQEGRMVYVDATFGPLRDSAGHVSEIVGSAVDVTARKEAEESRRESDLRFRQVVDNIREVFWMTDLEIKRMLYISPGYEEIWGRSCASLYDSPRDWSNAISSPNRDHVLETVIEQSINGTYDEEYDIVRPDGSVRRIRDRAFPVRDANGVVYRIAGVAEDITERKRLEEQLRQSHKMEAVGQMAGGIAHDFNNLLTIIIAHSELLLDELPLGSPMREFLEEIQQAGEQSAALTRQLLAFSRKQMPIPTVLDLNDVVCRTEKLLRRLIGEDIEVVTELHPQLNKVVADCGQMEQILINLAGNARDAMPQGGKLTIETNNVLLSESSAPCQSGAQPGAYVMLAVTDSGIGMTDEIQQRIFEPFFTTKEPGKGTGLGLAVVHGVLKHSQGHIEIVSKIGKGTAFKIYLPRSNDIAKSVTSQKGLENQVRGAATVLIVEDQPAVRALCGRILKGCGYTVLEAEDGVHALKCCKEHAEPIELLVTDVVMPGMGGRQLAEQMLLLHPNMKVLYMSGYTDDAVVRHGVARDEVNFLQKPFSAEALSKKVREVLVNSQPISNC